MLSKSSIFQKTQSESNDKANEFLDQSIAGIFDVIADMEDDLKREKEKHQRACFYQSTVEETFDKDLLGPHIKDHEDNINRYEKAIEAHTKRLNGLEKIKNSMPISVEEKSLLLKMEIFQNPIISDYQNIEKCDTKLAR